VKVLGLDLSLTQTAGCIVPSDWALDWRRITTMTVGKSLTREATLEEQARRLCLIVDAVDRFARAHSPDVAILEEYAFVTHVRSGVHALGELGGVVKRQLFLMGIPLLACSPQRARKMLGKAPRKDAKIWVGQQLYRAGAPKSWSLDECDAFVVANHYLAENGGHAIALAAA